MTNYIRPTFAELNSRIKADLLSVPAVLGEPLAAMWARACSSQHGYLDWILAQCTPLTCDISRLQGWSTLYQAPQLLAVAASGNVFATGSGGTPVLAGTLLRAQNGLNYRVTSAVTLSSLAPVSVPVICTTPGAVTNVAAGLILSLIDPVLGCDNNMTVDSSGLTGGADDELVDAWRLRVVEEWQMMVVYGGRAGKPIDYKFWAKSAHPSVSGALVLPMALGIGTVLVLPICNGLLNRLPSSAVLAAVAAYIPSYAPATAQISVAAPTVTFVTVTVTLNPTVNTLANQAAINTVLVALVIANVDEAADLLINAINAAIQSITSLYTLSAPVSDTIAASGCILMLNPVVFL